MNAYYPIFLNLAGKKCVVIGGGQVALRKVTTLLEYGAEITVISPRLCKGLREADCEGKIQVRRRAYQIGDLEGACIAVIAAGNRSVNLHASLEARCNKIPVNVVDDPGLSDFIVPSIVRRGSISIAISTAGKSPALARKLRSKLEGELDDKYAELALLIEGVRREVKNLKLKVSSKQWQEAIDLELMLDLIRQGNSQKARAILLERLSK
ncbi:MAG: bifunctional precorrin-2 dehydrogenase/sirohydrochlorin ferrochelatase [Chloroflexi bacterium]|nr:bifunctional precorrin-2 dehydrogenase/sirohydrochlorin ferrochelatase [Chloroflexota bacterium]